MKQQILQSQQKIKQLKKCVGDKTVAGTSQSTKYHPQEPWVGVRNWDDYCKKESTPPTHTHTEKCQFYKIITKPPLL